MIAEQKCERFIRKTGMLTEGDRVVAGVSGGADSVFLFYLLLHLRETCGITFRVLHLHHGIRGGEADLDAAFTEALCAGHGVPCEVVRRDIPGEAREKHLSEEEAGREARVELLRRAAGEMGAARIALAHHKDDLAETVLFRLARGTGLRGLAAMRPVSGAFIRPLLCLRKEEIKESLLARGIPWREDSTNGMRQAARNRIRLDIMPLIEGGVNAGAVDHFAEAAGAAAEAWDFLRGEAGRRSPSYVAEVARGALRISDALSGEMPVMQGEILRLALERLGPMRDVGRRQVEDIRKLWGCGERSRVDLPYGLTASRERGYVLLMDAAASAALGEDAPVPPGVLLAVDPGGRVRRTEWGDYALLTQVFPAPPDAAACAASLKSYTKWLDYDKIKGDIILRTRLNGDYLTIDSGGHRKKLSDYYTDEKIPLRERDRIPLVSVGNEILWVVGRRIAYRCRITADTRRVLQLEAVPAQSRDGGGPAASSERGV